MVALQSFMPEALATGAGSAAPAIDAFIDRKLNQYTDRNQSGDRWL